MHFVVGRYVDINVSRWIWNMHFVVGRYVDINVSRYVWNMHFVVAISWHPKRIFVVAVVVAAILAQFDFLTAFLSDMVEPPGGYPTFCGINGCVEEVPKPQWCEERCCWRSLDKMLGISWNSTWMQGCDMCFFAFLRDQVTRCDLNKCGRKSHHHCYWRECSACNW